MTLKIRMFKPPIIAIILYLAFELSLIWTCESVQKLSRCDLILFLKFLRTRYKRYTFKLNLIFCWGHSPKPYSKSQIIKFKFRFIAGTYLKSVKAAFVCRILYICLNFLENISSCFTAFGEMNSLPSVTLTMKNWAEPTWLWLLCVAHEKFACQSAFGNVFDFKGSYHRTIYSGHGNNV